MTALAAEASTYPTATLTISPTYGHAGDTFTLDCRGSTGSGTISARWDWDNDGEFDTAFSNVLTATHTYTVAGDHTARVEIMDQSGLTSAALQNLTLLPTTAISLEVAPRQVTVTPKDIVHFHAIGWDTYDNRIWQPTVTWSVTSSQAGAIDAQGFFTASVHAGSYPDAVFVTGYGITKTASVTIVWPFHVTLPLVIRND